MMSGTDDTKFSDEQPVESLATSIESGPHIRALGAEGRKALSDKGKVLAQDASRCRLEPPSLRIDELQTCRSILKRWQLTFRSSLKINILVAILVAVRAIPGGSSSVIAVRSGARTSTFTGL
jgi:hypothetical protein